MIVTPIADESFTIIDHQVYDLSDVMENLMKMDDVPEAYDYHDL